MAFSFNPFTHMHTFKNQASKFHKYIFLLAMFPKIKEIKKKKKSREAAPRVKDLSVAEQSKVRLGVVYCFKPSVPSNLCKQGRPIPHDEP